MHTNNVGGWKGDKLQKEGLKKRYNRIHRTALEQKHWYKQYSGTSSKRWTLEQFLETKQDRLSTHVTFFPLKGLKMLFNNILYY